MKKKYKILIGIVALLICIRILLPYVILHYANKTLADMEGYFGHIDDIDLSLYRGAYILNDMYLNKVDSVTSEQSNFFSSKNIDLSIEWRSLFQGFLVGELKFHSPTLIFSKDKVELKDVKNDANDFQKLLKDFMPIKVNKFEVINGEIHYMDNTSKPILDVALNQTHILALNLSNVTAEKVALPSTVTANAEMYEGKLTINMKLNALKEHPTFDLNAELQNTNLVLLNDILKVYGNFDVNKGTLGLYTEIAAKEGKFKGYVKPIIKDLDVVGPKEKHDNLFNKLYEHLIGAAGVVLRNQKSQQVATKASMEGDFENPKTDILDAIWEVLQNAFIQALMPSIDHEINLQSVETEEPDNKKNPLQRIFKSGKNKEEKKKK